MKQGSVFAILITLTTAVLIAIGTLWPNAAAVAYAGGKNDGILSKTSTPETGE